MTCKYNNDTETFENYLLDRIPQTERTDFETHLKTCEACRTKLEKEKLLLASLREIGKREMKDEIRRQVLLKQSKKTFTDWGMILKVAAVILFVVITPGLIYYYQYMAPQLAQYAVKEKTKIIDIDTSHSRTRLEGQELPERRQITADDARVNETLKGKVGEVASEQIIEKRTTPAAEEIPVSGDVLEGGQGIGVDRADGEIQKEEPTSPRQSVPEEMMDLISRGKIAPGLSQEGKVLHYEKETAISAASDKKSTYYQRETLSKLTQAQKIWQFRQASQNITLQLQLSDTFVLKDKKFPEMTPAQVIYQDSLETTIEWLVPPEIFELDPNQVTLYLFDSKNLQIQLPDKVTYHIDLQQRIQEAVQVRP